ncbi:HAD family hydrolase [Nocardioides acrostichi]|uniref:HAD-IA family hydrolase n=1 Tax=Nocardioides acrostichi TaxID=2784339 RepID=A0A930UY58_9ACTN|nr:HAD-IA family hydrolase [Nocardioides acrostichi]MBF4160262.1 HAD-IA family hydrolase [Nocardioides acrostichi]
MTALLLGSISTLIDTSELQRQAFNDAFAEHGLEWSWSQEEYRSLLDSNGGRDRIAAFAEARGEEVDADAVHATKSAKFREALTGSPLAPRAGVVETVAAAREAGAKVALVTTTSPDNVAAVLQALDGAIEFDTTVDSGQVEAGKPDPAAYALALERLEESPEACVAVEDNPGGAASAAAAGVRCLGFPNENTAGLDLGDVVDVVDRLDPARTTELLGA